MVGFKASKVGKVTKKYFATQTDSRHLFCNPNGPYAKNLTNNRTTSKTIEIPAKHNRQTYENHRKTFENQRKPIEQPTKTIETHTKNHRNTYENNRQPIEKPMKTHEKTKKNIEQPKKNLRKQ